MSASEFETHQLSKKFPKSGKSGSWVGFENVSLNILQGDFISIVGASGCGKSTLLRVLAGLETKTSGQITRGRSQATIGYVFQEHALLPWKNLIENVGLPLSLMGQPYETEAKFWIQKLGLSGFERSMPHELSGGMKMRAALARALISKPDILFLDEPFSALDEPIRIKLAEEIRNLWLERPTTILFVTHSISEALWMSSRVLVLQGQPGRVVLDERPDFPAKRNYSLRATEDFGRISEKLLERIAKDSL